MRNSFHFLILASLWFLCSVAFSQSPQTPGNDTTRNNKLDRPNNSTTLRDTAATDTTGKRKKEQVLDTVNYEADRIEYNAEQKILILRGKAIVKYQNITLQADTIEYFTQDNLFTARGLPQLVDGNDTTVGEFMAYNIKTRRGRVKYATTHFDEAYFSGNQIVKSKGDELYVHQGDYTTCAVVDSPHFYFYGRDIKVTLNDKIIARPAVLNIGDAPVAIAPYFVLPTERNRRSGFLTPIWRGQPSGRMSIDNIGYYYVPNEYVDFSFAGQVSDFNEFMLRTSSRYLLKYRLDGNISINYNLTSDFLNKSDQWQISYSHNQNITPDALTKLSGSGSVVSRRDFIQRYSYDTFDLKQQNLRANLALSQSFPQINAAANINWDRTHDLSREIITQDFPSVSFSLPSRPIIPERRNTFDLVNPDTTKAAWYNKIYAGYSFTGNNRIVNNKRDTIRDFYHPGLSQSANISYSDKILKYINFNPSLNVRLTSVLGYYDAKPRDSTLIRGEIDTISVRTVNPSPNSFLPDTFLSFAPDTIDSAGGFQVIRQRAVVKKADRMDYIRDTLDREFFTVPSWQTGVSLSTDIYGIFPIRVLNLLGIRHTFRPTVSFTYVPEISHGKRFFDVGVSPDLDRDKQMLLGLGVSNQFDGKFRASKPAPSQSTTDQKIPLLNLSAGTSYDFQKDSLQWSNLSVSASTSYQSLGINYSSSYWLYDEFNQLHSPILSGFTITLSLLSLNAKGTLWGGDKLVLDSLQPADPIEYNVTTPQAWSFNLQPSFSYSQSRKTQTDVFVPTKTFGLSSSAQCDFTKDWSISWSGSYNFVENQFVQNSINLNCDLECWEMRFEWRPERLNPGYYFLINVKKIPEIKWDLRS